MRSSVPRSRAPALLIALVLSCALAALSCAADVKRLPERGLTIVRADGTSARLRAEIADDEDERNRGLMHRKEVRDGEGMLFVFESDRQLAFWMKNTLVPLSIAYVASDGRILEFRDMTPLSLAPVESSRAARYALEVPQGWFSRAGVAVGDRLVLE